MRRCPWRQGCAIDNVHRRCRAGTDLRCAPCGRPRPPGLPPQGKPASAGRRRAQAEAWLARGRPLALFAKKVQQQHRPPLPGLGAALCRAHGVRAGVSCPAGWGICRCRAEALWACGRPRGGAKRRAAGSSGPIGLPAGVSATPVPAGRLARRAAGHSCFGEDLRSRFKAQGRAVDINRHLPSCLCVQAR